MKKKKHIDFDTERNVFKIDVDVMCCDILIYATADTRFTAERTHRTRLKIAESDGVVTVRQTGKPLFRRAAIKLCVPAYCVPDISIKSGSGRINIADGTFGDLQIRSSEAEVILCRASLVNAELNCARLKLFCKEISVKRSFDCIADEGGTLMESCAFAKLYLNYKACDTGISNLKCPDASVTSSSGSINVILNGAQADYTIKAMSKCGTCNRDVFYGGANVLKAYSEYGNIVIDFTEKAKEVEYYGNDDVAENSCVACGS